MNNFSTPVIVKYMEKNLDMTKPCYSEQIFPVLGLSFFEVPPYVLGLPVFFFFIVFNLQPFGVTESIVFICVKIGKQKSRK